jgi:hypothetical protein
MLKFFVEDLDSEFGAFLSVDPVDPGSGMERIRDKNSGSATLLQTVFNFLSFFQGIFCDISHVHPCQTNCDRNIQARHATKTYSLQFCLYAMELDI